MIVHRDANNNLSLGQAGKLNGIEVEFRPSHHPEEGAISVMRSAIGKQKYILMARVEPSLEDMAAAISEFLRKEAEVSKK